MRKQKPFYTLAEAAKLLGVHYETAARWARSGKLPSVKLSRRKVIIPKGKCEALLAGHLEAKEWEALPVGHPRRWLPLVGSLTHEEAEKIMAAVQDFEKVEEEL